MENNTIRFELQFLNEKHDSVCIIEEITPSNITSGKIWTYRSESSLQSHFLGDGKNDNFSASTHFSDENFTLENIINKLNNRYDSIAGKKVYEFVGKASHFIPYLGFQECSPNFFNK